MSSCNDGSFGPGSNCRALDFTLYFEASVLSITPDALFLACALFRIAFLWRRPSLLARYGLRTAVKAFASFLVVASSAAVLGTYAQMLRSLLPEMFLPAVIISFLASIVNVALVYMEHARSTTPSTLVICYGLCKGLFGATILRSFAAIGIRHTSLGAFSILALSTSSYFALCLAELIEKKSLFPNEIQEKMFGEATASFISRSLFLFLFPLMRRGRKTRLTLDDLGEVPEENRAQQAREPLIAALESTKQSPTWLLRATFKSFGVSMLLPIIPRLVLLIATFTQPLLVNRMISLIQDPTEPTQKGWYLVGGFVCVFGTMTVSTAVYWQKVYAITVRYRAALVGTIYRKALRLASHSSRSVGIGGASTYMSVDVERISEGIEVIHEFWSALVSIPLAVALLYQQASWAAFVPLGVIAIILMITAGLGKKVGRHQAAWLGATDKRIKLLSSVISQFLPIKMSGYEGLLAEKITDLRLAEMKQAALFYQVIVWTGALSNAASTFCSLATLGAYAGISKAQDSGYDLNVTKIFTILTTVNLLNSPLNMLGQGLPDVLAAYASVKRIQGFLSLDEKQNITLELQAAETRDEKDNQDETLRITDGTFSWLPDSPQVLHDINILIQPGKIHMLVGPVASGKTTLLLSLLGETTLVNGRLDRPRSSIAYASQDAFVVVGTCRENILFGRSYDEARYGKVVEACALLPDFERLPFGDQTKLGDKGVSLSGGQRQRLALARAVYANTPLIFLDDVLSALDAETEKHVFEALFGPTGLLKGKTVLLSTHSIHHLPSSDQVLVMEDGKVLHQGTFDEVQDSGYDLVGSIATRKAAGSSSGGQGKDATEGNEKEKSPSVHDDTEDDETARAYDSGGWAPYKFFASKIGYDRSIIIILFISLYSAVRLGIQGFIKEWSESDGQHLPNWLGGYVAFSFASFLTGTIAFWYLGSSITMHSGRNLHIAQLTAVFAAPASLFLSTPAGRLINRFSSDIFVIDFTFPIAVLNGLSNLTSIIGNLILIYIATPWLAISAPPMALGYWLLIKFYLGTSKQLQQLEAASKSPLYTVFSNTLSGLETVRAFKVQSHFQGQNDLALNRSQGPFYFRFGGMRFLRTTLSFATMIIAVGIASLAVGLRRTTSAGFLGIALSNLTSLASMLSFFLMSYSQIENGTVSIRRIHEMASLEPERDEGATDIAIPSKKGLWPVKGSIVFEDFGLKYREDLEPALKNISFTVKGGQRIGVCGRTGSGKSSTIMALFRMIDQSLVTGRILLDGVDIATVPLSLLRNSLSLVSQEPFLWHASLREILDIEGVHSDDELWDALGRVGMKDSVAAMEQKLDTVIEDGGSLSRGQKQLICLARVLLRKSQVVVLDEATSSMDIATDQKIRQVVQRDLSEQTVIAVAHRIATIIDFDLILVLENGHVAEYGSPADLLSNSDSRFSRLAATQGVIPGTNTDSIGHEIQETAL